MTNRKLGIILLVTDFACISLDLINAISHLQKAEPGKAALWFGCAGIYVVCSVLHYLTWLKKN